MSDKWMQAKPCHLMGWYIIYIAGTLAEISDTLDHPYNVILALGVLIMGLSIWIITLAEIIWPAICMQSTCWGYHIYYAC